LHTLEDLRPDAGATIPHSLLDLIDTAGVGLCGAPGFGRGHAGHDPFVRDHIDVDTNFIVKLTLDLPLPE
jgi:hypothetical protein